MTMHCEEFERAWGEKLDARGAWPAGLARELDAHAAACPACRAVDARYRALSLALDALARAPELPVPEGFADRVLAAADRNGTRLRVLAFSPSRLRWAAAAAVVVMAVGLGLLARGRHGVATRPGPAPGSDIPAVASVEADDLGAALFDATSATLALAREASAPAARVGREVFADADLPGATTALRFPEGVVPTGMLQGVGERVNAGVRPLSGTARSAFSFLFAAPAGGERPAPPATPHGA